MFFCFFFWHWLTAWSGESCSNILRTELAVWRLDTSDHTNTHTCTVCMHTQTDTRTHAHYRHARKLTHTQTPPHTHTHTILPRVELQSDKKRLKLLQSIKCQTWSDLQGNYSSHNDLILPCYDDTEECSIVCTDSIVLKRWNYGTTEIYTEYPKH